MPSEKEEFVTKQYIPMGEPIVQNDHTIIYHVKCLCEPGKPDGILKMYRQQNREALYKRLYQLDYSEWPHIYNVKYFDGNTLVVEKYLEGNTLEELLKQNKENNTVFSEEDAYRIMKTNGPRGRSASDVVLAKGLFISPDIVAVDTAAAKFFNQVREMPLDTVGHLAKGEALKVGTMNLDKLNVKRIKM